MKTNINVCYLSGTIISDIEFNFFFNSKKLISKAMFLLKTEEGFRNSNIVKSIQLEVRAYDEMADLIYRDFAIGDIVMLQAFLEGDKVILENVLKMENSKKTLDNTIQKDIK